MIKIIDYDAGNASSVMRAVEHLGLAAAYARHPSDLADATHILLPGVGSARATMDSLREMSLLPALNDAVLCRKVPYLGICVGLQILFERSDEGDAQCFGWLKGRVYRFDVGKVRVPQMGWNRVHISESPINAPQDDYFYFVNSYYAAPDDASDIWGTADYDGAFAAAVHRDNIYATQFHIEKSAEAGLALLSGFLRLGMGTGTCTCMESEGKGV